MTEEPTKGIFYGSLYNDEMPIYREKIETQFKNVSEKMKKAGQEVAAWGFDVMVDDLVERSFAMTFVHECAAKYFPGVENISVVANKDK